MLSQYEKKKKVFQMNCRSYEMQKKELVEMRMKYPGIDRDVMSLMNVYDDRSAFYAAHRYIYLKQEVDWIENVFRTILNEYGDFIYRLFYCRFVEHRTQEDVAHELGITRRQLQYEEDKTMRSLLERYNEGQGLTHISE